MRIFQRSPAGLSDGVAVLVVVVVVFRFFFLLLVLSADMRRLPL